MLLMSTCLSEGALIRLTKSFPPHLQMSNVLLPDQFRGVSAVQFAFRLTRSLLTPQWLPHSLIPALGRCRCEHCQTKRRPNLWHPPLEDCVWLIHACHHNQTQQTANLLNHLCCCPFRSDFPSLFVSLSLITHSLRRNLPETPLCHPYLIVLDRCHERLYYVSSDPMSSSEWILS